MADESDILEGSTLTETLGFMRIVENWRHTDVAGSSPTIKKLAAAARTAPAGSVLAGTNLTLKEKVVEPESMDTFTTRLTYETPSGGAIPPEQVGDPPKIEVFGTLEQTTTNVDKDGNLIVVPVPAGLVGVPITPEVALQVPRYGIRYITRESVNPSNKAATYVGRVNSATFLGKPPRTWLCGPIRGSSDDGGLTYVVNYELFYDVKTWASRLRWEDRDGVLHDPEILKNVQPEADLNGLGLGV